MTTTVTPQELGQVLDVAAKAQVPLGQAYTLAPVLSKLIVLTNQKCPIGPVDYLPEPSPPDAA